MSENLDHIKIVYKNSQTADISDLLRLAFKGVDCTKEQATRYSFMVEEVLTRWKECLDKEKEVTFERYQTKKDTCFDIYVEGEKVGPAPIANNEYDLPINIMIDNLKSGIGNEFKYIYKNNVNKIHICIPQKNVQETIFLRNLKTILVPVSIQSAFLFMMLAVDTFALGFLDTNSMSAVSLVSNYINIYNKIIIAFTIGMTIISSQFWGKRDRCGVKDCLTASIIITFLLACCFLGISFYFSNQIMQFYTDVPDIIEKGKIYLKSVLPILFFTAINLPLYCFMKNIGRIKQNLIYSCIGALCNVLLDIVLIFGFKSIPAMGIKGAAIASVLSTMLQTGLAIADLYKSGFFKTVPKKPFNFKIFSLINKNATPIIADFLVYNIAINITVSAIGHMGADLIAAYAVNGVLYNLYSILANGISTSVEILIGNLLGRKDFNNALSKSKVVVKFSTKVAFWASFLYIASCFLFPLFSLNLTKQAVYFLNILIIIGAVNTFFKYKNEAYTSILYSGGDAKSILYLDTIYMWGICVSVSILSIYFIHIPVVLFLILIRSSNSFSFPLLYHRYKSKKWLKEI